jgi:hypothetical protein
VYDSLGKRVGRTIEREREREGEEEEETERESNTQSVGCDGMSNEGNSTEYYANDVALDGSAWGCSALPEKQVSE